MLQKNGELLDGATGIEKRQGFLGVNALAVPLEKGAGYPSLYRAMERSGILLAELDRASLIGGMRSLDGRTGFPADGDHRHAAERVCALIRTHA